MIDVCVYIYIYIIIEQNPYIAVSTSSHLIVFVGSVGSGTGNFKAESWGEGHTRELVAWAGGSQVRGSRFVEKRGGFTMVENGIDVWYVYIYIKKLKCFQLPKDGRYILKWDTWTVHVIKCLWIVIGKNSDSICQTFLLFLKNPTLSWMLEPFKNQLSWGSTCWCVHAFGIHSSDWGAPCGWRQRGLRYHGCITPEKKCPWFSCSWHQHQMNLWNSLISRLIKANFFFLAELLALAVQMVSHMDSY